MCTLRAASPKIDTLARCLSQATPTEPPVVCNCSKPIMGWANQPAAVQDTSACAQVFILHKWYWDSLHIHRQAGSAKKQNSSLQGVAKPSCQTRCF